MIFVNNSLSYITIGVSFLKISVSHTFRTIIVIWPFAIVASIVTGITCVIPLGTGIRIKFVHARHSAGVSPCKSDNPRISGIVPRAGC